MFEGLVRQLILGYLGRYIKDIHREQLKITLWNEEVLLENVELILEAFDYLELPFALKQGRVGRLSIRIPWKKLGWDPIIIILEDILVCASQRKDEEWSTDNVERREFAGKKAKLATAELAKLSQRVCDDQTGNSFLSYITAKIIDGIQVSIRNIHVVYGDVSNDKALTVFGLKLASLTAMKLNLTGLSSGKVRTGQVKKVVEIQGLEIYCRTFHGSANNQYTDNGEDSMSMVVASIQNDEHVHLLAPVDVSASISVNRSGRLENNAAQYSIDVELSGLVLSLNEDQLQQILYLYDYLCICRLREKYGRYRPWRSPLSMRPVGWQIQWWHFAQQSVLSDVRKRLKRTSWKYLGERIGIKRRYVNLYKLKLECLRKEEPLDSATVLELDQMEKEYDIDDILSFRSVAENELQEFLVDSISAIGVNEADTAFDKSLDDDQTSSKPQGWLKWLSRGMLGAGGTDDSSQFSGVVSDEVIKDIYEATKFHPTPSPDLDAAGSDRILLSSIKFSIHQISATLRNKKFDRAIAELVFVGNLVECMIWEDSAVVNASINAVEMMNPLSEHAILLVKRVVFVEAAEHDLEVEKPSLNIQAYIPKENREGELTLKVLLEPVKVICDPTFFLNIMEFYTVLDSFKSHEERVLKSLNGINDVKARLISKAEYILSSRKRMMWDISLKNVKIIIPWEIGNSEIHNLVLGLTGVTFASKHDIGCIAPDINVPTQFTRNLIDLDSSSDILKGIQIQDLHDHFEVKIIDFEINLSVPYSPHTFPILEKLNASSALALCIVQDEPLLKTLEVYVVVETLLAHLSPSIVGAVLELIESVDMLYQPSHSGTTTASSSYDMDLPRPKNISTSWISVIANLDSSKVIVDLENGLEASCTLTVSLQDLEIRFNVKEFVKACWICSRAFKVTSYSLKSGDDLILCLSENGFSTHSSQQYEDESNVSPNGCLMLHYDGDLAEHRFSIWLSDVDLHCYPYIIGLLDGFIDKLSKCAPSHAVKNQNVVGSSSTLSGSYFDFQKFGCSNISETSSSDWESISVEHYPFVTIYNERSLFDLESSLIDISPDWKRAFNIRGSKINSSKFSAKEEFQKLYTPFVGTNGINLPSDLDQVGLVVVNLHLSSIRLHFHDSKCIVASATLPAAKSSISIHEDSFDVLCSTEGLIVSSYWYPQALKDCLWGPASPNLSPVLNIRVKKGNRESAGSRIELDFGIQNVSCILPPEFLAILIGYFSLPDWNSHEKESPAGDNISLTYKFEILDSILFAPVVNARHQFLKLDIPQLYCSFIENSDLGILLKGVPAECCVPDNFIADHNHCLNLFGRSLSLHYLLMKDEASDPLKSNHIIERSVRLIESFSGDIWIKIPYGSENLCTTAASSICVMSRISNSQLIVEGSDILGCFGLLGDVIEEFSSVENLSRCFTSDVLHFFQSKRSSKENHVLPIESSTVSLIEVRCSIQAMSVNLYSQQIESLCKELVAKADMIFTCAVSIKNDKPLFLDMSFTSLTLSSLFPSVVLVECASSIQNASAIRLNFLVSDEGEKQLHFSLPSVKIWLFLSDWSRVIDLFYSSCVQLSTIRSEESNKPTLDLSDRVDTPDSTSPSIRVSSYISSEDIVQPPFLLIVKSDHIGVKIYVPVQVSEKAYRYVGAHQIQEQNPFDNYSFLSICLQSRCMELNINDKNACLKSNIGKITGAVELCQNKSVHSWPLFQLLQVDVETDITNDETGLMHLKVDIQCDNLDVWLSHDTFYFWQAMHLLFPEEESGPSQIPMCGISLKFLLRKLSILLTDQKWSSSGPLLEILMGSFLFHGIITENLMEGSIDSELQVNYNNIHKVLWEPFLEPWKFQVSLRREHGKSALQNSPVMTDVHVESRMNLNINVTESLIEVAFRASDMIKDAWDPMELNVISENSRFMGAGTSENALSSRYAPYTLENLTSLPLVFYITKGSKNADGFDASSLKDGKYVQPGSSYPVYINDTPDKQTYSFSTSHSSDNLGERKIVDVQHHYIIVQLEGTSTLSTPISIDLVGVSSFEVDFSNASTNMGVDGGGDISKGAKEFEGNRRLYSSSSYVVPVLVDVSVQRYTKLVRLYSTVILLNATSVPFEVRFDIPFGVSPKILDPVYPGCEFPLPLHLAETGRIRWRPSGSTYLWSEAYSISNILSYEIKIGYLRSFVCYPSLPSSDPFRCCVSVHDLCLPSVGRINKGSSLYTNETVRQSAENHKGDKIENQDHLNKRCIHLVTLSDPLVVINYLPNTISLMIESGGVTRSVLLSEVETSFYHIDSSHDLLLNFHIHGIGSSVVRFPRAEKFSKIAKFSGTKFSSSESVNFNADDSKGPLYVTMEKVMDAFSGSREICVFVPFLLYNCCGFPLIVANSTNGLATRGCIVPSCYDIDERGPSVGKEDGLGLLSSNLLLHNDGVRRFPLNNNLVSTRKSLGTYNSKFLKESFTLSGSSITALGGSEKKTRVTQNSSLHEKEKGVSRSQPNGEQIDFSETNRKKVNFCMYSPDPNLSSSEIMVRVRRCQSDIDVESISDYAWSNQFFLVPPTGSASILVPQSSNNASYMISVASSAVAGPFSGKTRIINFQPRYVISNACSKDLCYRQKGSDFIYHLKVGQHTHIHWTDITRELLISVRFDEPGWQWSGCFFPEHLGDTQLKMRNYVSGAVNMVRVEVQNADDAIRDEKILGNPHGDSGTNLILLSDDDTGFMPYRIDNFSKERLRIYQQKCEAVETVIHSYTSCPYAWDEPCYPHRLTVEVFAERVIGSYSLDDAKEYKPVYLPAKAEKPERRLLLSVHAEGALKVLSVIDSSFHSFDDIKTPHSPRLNDKREYDPRQENSVLYKERLSISIPFIGISIMNSQPQELLFACARNTMIDLVQSLDQQKFSLKVFALQIDNQLPTTPYPVILSFDHENKQIQNSQIKTKEENLRVKGERKQFVSDKSCEPVFSLAAAKWRNKDKALLSFEHISLRMTDFHLELEQDVILGLLDFFKRVSTRFHSKAMPHMDSVLHPLSSNFSVNMKTKVFETHQTDKADGDSMFLDSKGRSQIGPLLPSVVPIGAPWQKIYLLARKQKKIYVEVIEVAPITLTLSFSSSPWVLRNGILTSGEYLIHRGLMALADVEGARIHLRQLTISHQLASLESIREILIIHYTQQLLHEMYKVFGSAGVIGNPMGFARSVGLGIKDFLSVPARSFMQSPAGLITGMAQGTTSLLSNTVYAISDAATQVSRAAHKGIVAFTMDDPTAMEIERQQKGMSSHGKGVINELLEGLTGLLQSPIRGAEKHGLPGVLSGIALGVTGLVARPAASILEVTEKTARSIRNRSKLYHVGSERLRVRLPRPLSRDYPLRPYLWEEAVGLSVLADADDALMLKDETLILSKPIKQGGKFAIITERLLLIVSCPSLVHLGKPEFRGVPADPDWDIETEITLDSVIHVDTDEEVVHIVGSSSDIVFRQNQNQQKRGVGNLGKQRWYKPPTPLPLFQMNLECSCKEEAVELLKVLLATIEKGKVWGWGCVHRLHQSNVR